LDGLDPAKVVAGIRVRTIVGTAYTSRVPSAFLAGYLARLGLPAAGAPDIDTLRRLHAAHVGAIPFENLDILLGHGVHLELDRLRDKLVARRRGGYCFEHNTLLLAVLRAIGFDALSMEARVRAGSTTLRPRTHMVLVVRIGGVEWLADAGFGGDGLLEPVSLGGEPSASSAGLVHRAASEGDLRVLQVRRGAEWEDQYAFALHAVHPIDFEVASWFTSTHPSSPFVRTLTAQRTTREVRYVLRYPAYSESRESGTRVRDIARSELLPLLREAFTIDLPDDTMFPAIDGPAAVAGA
jgi:N-hydroxyarylamine O-acetyltransferase